MNKLFGIILLSVSVNVSASGVFFDGAPVKKVEVSGQSSSTYVMSEAQSEEYKVVISRDGENYYWTSRNNVRLVPVESGYYVTFIAVNGSGYVRTLMSDAREIFSLLPPEDQKNEYLYVEHLIHQLGSITYYGR